MKKIHELTPHQAFLAEKHIGLVYRFLQQNRLKEDEFYDIIIFGYLLAVQEYDENPRLAGYSFSTIAWRRMQNAVKDHFSSANRSVEKSAAACLHSRRGNLFSLDELLPDRKKDLQEQTADRLLTLEIISCLTETEQRIVQMKSEGFRHREIAALFHTTAHGISNRLYRMRLRLSAMSCLSDRTA